MPDPFATFPTEVSLHVLAFLNPLSLARISSVSILWYELANLPDVWRSACLSLYPIALTAGVVVADDELETLSKEYRCERRSTENYLSQLYGNAILPPWSEMDLSKIRSLRLGLRENFVACCRDPKSFFTDALLIIKTIVPPLPPPPVGCPSNFVNLLRYGLAASTSGHQRNIRNTLEEGSWAFTIWSSSGSESKPEWLCYKMPEDLCIVRGVEVLPGAVSEGNRFYRLYTLAPKRIRFSFGFNDNPAQMHYHSRWFDVKFESVAQYFDLSPDLIVGGYLFITTEGIHKSHIDKNFNYISFRHVKAQGISLCLEDPPTIDLNWPAFGEMRRTLQKWKKLRLEGLGFQENVNRYNDIITFGFGMEFLSPISP